MCGGGGGGVGVCVCTGQNKCLRPFSHHSLDNLAKVPHKLPRVSA